jgi:hypothetical protein
MSKPLLSLCSIPKLAIRDGYVGATARLLLPFYQYGYWFASGQQYTFPGATLAQDTSRTLGGTVKPNTYTKEAGVCLDG